MNARRSRWDDRRRPSRPAPRSTGARTRSRRTFGATWWGAAWIDALENRARLDPNRLPRGRTYARQGRVDALVVEPGLILAAVAGSRATPYRVTIRVGTFDDAGWDRLLDAVASRAAHTAALLDGELTPDIVADAQQAGVELLPGPGDLQPRCSCPDWADPCKHSAAVCYLMADRLDEDPFELLHVRGRTRDVVLDELRRRRSVTGTTGAPAGVAPRRNEPATDRGLPAREAWSRSLAALPDVPRPRARAGRPAPPVGGPDGPSPLSASSLERLALDAARRAWEAARDDTAGLALDLDHDVDLARRASLALGTPAWDELVRAAGVPPRNLVERASAWRVAGAGGVRLIQSGSWRPDPLVMAAARDRLAGHAPTTVRANTITVGGHVQLRLGHDLAWYRFDRRGPRSWELTAGPADDPDVLLGP